ncbi:hypothetical protein J3458_002992 [Metarhizium acridum]|uniref:uncharacterized protein n=1 Tax=Metarhizium acridum TaxID=92637 RepID=UPI001C6CDE48|nr:hypothetical protein J3458_002992 [Metarhizium acridum]
MPPTASFAAHGAGRATGGRVPRIQDPYDHFHDGVPEPIIEEPVSPPSSPVQPTKLLEFHISNDDSSSWEPETEEDNCFAERIDLNPTVSFSEVTEPMSAIRQ